MIKLIYISVFSLCFASCSKDFSSEKEMYEWLQQDEHGLTKSKKLGEMTMKMKYLPAEYLVYNDVKRNKNYAKKEVDSLRKTYNSSYAFLLSFEFNNTSPGDNVLLNGIDSYEDYKQRIENMNFNLDEYIHIEGKNEQLVPPVLWNLENTYNVGDKRNIYLVFEKNSVDQYLKNGTIDIVFNDSFFNTGINHFTFNSKDLASVPKINFWKF